MPLMLNCTNKECGKYMEPYLKPKTDLVYCSECDCELTNTNHFIISQMKALKQFKKKVQESFAIKCHQCKKQQRPLLKDKAIICPACKTEHILSEPIKIMLSLCLKSAGSDI
jgi:ribosomal protein L34E